jgi:hypothetical protein
MAERDFLARVDAIRRTLAALVVEPAKETLRRAIHDGWRIILRPRAGAMLARLDDLIKAKYWSFGDDDKADFLTPEGWKNNERDLSTLYVEVAGCLAQYLRIHVVWQPQLQFGAKAGSNAPMGSPGEVEKEKEKQEKAAADLHKKLDAVYGKALEDVLKDWKAKQEALAKLLDALRDLVAELEDAEEERLRAAVAAGRVAPGANPTALAASLERAKLARIDLAHFRGVPPSAFGSLLTKWRQAQTAVASKVP